MKLKHEQIQYIEFLSRDLKVVRAFYETAFSWKFTEYGPTYIGFAGDYVDGGFELGEPKRGSILVILYSTDLESTKSKVIVAGGELTKDTFDFPGGKRFQFTDPDGNELAVWSDVS
jgi:predicted enzyme related to lactoylglutathione lyase